jgi:hypothetical protein
MLIERGIYVAIVLFHEDVFFLCEMDCRAVDTPSDVRDSAYVYDYLVTARVVAADIMQAKERIIVRHDLPPSVFPDGA